MTHADFHEPPSRGRQGVTDTRPRWLARASLLLRGVAVCLFVVIAVQRDRWVVVVGTVGCQLHLWHVVCLNGTSRYW